MRTFFNKSGLRRLVLVNLEKLPTPEYNKQSIFVVKTVFIKIYSLISLKNLVKVHLFGIGKFYQNIIYFLLIRLDNSDKRGVRWLLKNFLKTAASSWTHLLLKNENYTVLKDLCAFIIFVEKQKYCWVHKKVR